MPKVNKTAVKKTRPPKYRALKKVLDRIAPVHIDNTKDKINIYGVSGSGKTTLACTYPKPLLIIGAEDGTRSVHNVKGVSFVRLLESEEMIEVLDHVKATDKYRTVVLDTATTLQDLILKEVLGLEELPAQKSWGMATRDQYGQSAVKTKEYLRHLLRLAESGQCHTVILAQERSFGGEGDDNDLLAPHIMSALTASTVGWLNPQCDYIVQTFIREGTQTKIVKVGTKEQKLTKKTGTIQYALRTRAHPIFTIKFRGPKREPLPEYITDPTFQKIHTLIKEGAI